MRIDIIPNVGFNNILFGMSRDEVREKLGEPEEFYKADDDVNTTDDFGFCHVFFDENNKCEAVEIFDEAEVYMDNMLIFPTDLASAEKIIEDSEQDDDGLISYSGSIGIYAPDGAMESILCGKKGYYDEH